MRIKPMLRHKELKREENYVATENGRAIRQVKASWSRQMFFFFYVATNSSANDKD